MLQEQHRELFKDLCRAFPHASIALLNPRGEAALYYPADQPPLQAAYMDAFYYDPITASYLQTIALSNGWNCLIRGTASTVEKARERSRMAESIAGLINRQSEMLAQLNDTRSNMALLANRLFHVTTADGAAFLALWGIEIGFDLSLPRAICVFDMQSAEGSVVLQSSMLRMIQNNLKAGTSAAAGGALPQVSQNIVAPLGGTQIVLLQVVQSPADDLRRLLYPALSSVCAMLMDQYNLSVRVGIGSVPGAIYEYGVSLAQAQSALKYAKLFETRQAISFISDFAFEDELASLPKEVLEHFLEPYIRRLTSPQLYDTIHALLRCNMDISQTAAYLYVHRNTVLFRLEQIKRSLELNPLHSDSDRFTLRMIYTYYKLYH